MRKLLLLLSIILIFSCTTERTPKSLITSERIIDSIPDSALHILISAQPDIKNYGKRELMKYYLLYAEAMNKAYIPMDTIKFMDKVLEYYKHKGVSENLVIAYYMQGCIYRDRGNSPKAIFYYNEAIKTDSSETGVNDFILLSRIYSQKAEIYHEQHYPTKAIDSWKQGRKYALLGKDTLSSIQLFERIGGEYLLLGNEKRANDYFRKAYHEYFKKGYKQYAAACMIYFARYDLKIKEVTKAGQELKKYRDDSKLFNKQGTPLYGNEVYYFYLGSYYEQIKNYEKSINCFSKLLTYDNDIENLEDGYRGLLNVYSKLSEPDSISKYAKLYALISDSANVIKNSSEIIKMESLYNYTENQELALTKIKEAKNLWKVLTFTFLAIFILIFVFVHYYLKFKTKTKNVRTEYYNAVLKLQYVKEELDSVQKDSEMFKKQKINEIKELKEYISNHEINVKANKWTNERTILNHSSVEHTRKLASHGQQISEKEWANLEKTIKLLLPDFYEKIAKVKDGLTHQEYKVCLLTKIHFTPIEISTLLNISQQRVTNLRSSINIKLFNKKGAHSLSQNIMRM